VNKRCCILSSQQNKWRDTDAISSWWRLLLAWQFDEQGVKFTFQLGFLTRSVKNEK